MQGYPISFVGINKRGESKAKRRRGKTFQPEWLAAAVGVTRAGESPLSEHQLASDGDIGNGERVREGGAIEHFTRRQRYPSKDVADFASRFIAAVEAATIGDARQAGQRSDRPIDEPQHLAGIATLEQRAVAATADALDEVHTLVLSPGLSPLEAPVAGLLNKDYAARRREAIDTARATLHAPAGDPYPFQNDTSVPLRPVCKARKSANPLLLPARCERLR